MVEQGKMQNGGRISLHLGARRRIGAHGGGDGSCGDLIGR